MSMPFALNHPQVWSAKQLQQAPPKHQASGHEELDRLLYGGWPESGLVELNYSQRGIGELRLLWPLLKQTPEKTTKQQANLQVWVNPPAGVHSQALAQAGINLQQLVIVQCANPKEALWAAEQSLQSGCCQYVVLWQQHMRTSEAKRLQWAAKDNDALLFWLREASTDRSGLPISARLQLSPCPQGIHIEVNKLQGQWPPAGRTIPLHDPWPELYAPALAPLLGSTPAPSNNVIPLR